MGSHIRQSSTGRPPRPRRAAAGALAVVLAAAALYAQPGAGTANAAASPDAPAVAAATGGAVDYFLKIDGILGESLDRTHRDSIEISSWSWGASTPGTASAGGGAGAGKVSFSDLSLSASTSKASPLLLAALAKGTHLKSAVLYGRKAGGAGAAGDYLTVTLTDVLVSSFQTSAAGEAPSDSFNLSFMKVEYSYRTQTADGKLGPPVTAGWDRKANKPV